MEGNKGQSIFLSVVGVATLLVAIVGATFAYFSINVTGNEEASSIQITTEVVGGVEFIDDENINVTNIYPGWSEDKTFTVAQTSATATGEIRYYVQLYVAENSLTAVADDEFQHSLSGESNVLGSTGTLAGMTIRNVPSDVGLHILGNNANDSENVAILSNTETHTYTYHIEFDESHSNQDNAQGKAFRGVLQVNLVPGQGLRTYSAEGEGWTTWSAS